MDIGFGNVVSNLLLFLSTQAEKLLVVAIALLALEWLMRRDQEGVWRSLAIQGACILLCYLVLKNADSITTALLGAG